MYVPPPRSWLQLDEVRQLYRELHAQVERLTEHHEDSSQKVIDAVAEHHKRQAGFLQGGGVGGVAQNAQYIRCTNPDACIIIHQSSFINLAVFSMKGQWMRRPMPEVLLKRVSGWQRRLQAHRVGCSKRYMSVGERL